MKNKVFKGQEVDQNIPGDTTIIGIRWLGEEASDISFELKVDRWHASLTCFWAVDFKSTLDQTGYIGVMPMLDCELLFQHDCWNVRFDLSPWGFVELRCNDIQLEVHSTSESS